MTGQALPLWRQLQAAASVLQSVREGASATAALARIDGALRPAAQSLAFHAFRNLGRAEALPRLLANPAPPPMTLRVNVRKTTQEAYLSLLAESGVEAHAVGEHGVILTRAMPVSALPGFTDGVISVQDAAAQLAAPLLLNGLLHPRHCEPP